MMTKYFVQLSHAQFSKVVNLIGYAYNQPKIDKIIEKSARSTISPLRDDQIANSILYNGNILIDMPD